MVKNDLAIKEEYIILFERMIKEISKNGSTHICPRWRMTLVDNFNSDNDWSEKKMSLVDNFNSDNHCNICMKYFYKSFKERYNVIGACPCSHYTPAYLIRFLKKVISNS